MKLPLYYDDICLIPDNYSDLVTRDDASTSVEFLGKTYKNPVIPANMASVVNIDVCRRLANNEYFYIMHRFGTFANEYTVSRMLVAIANDEQWPLISISTGVNDISKRDLKWIVDNNLKVDVITIDVALGFHKKVAEVIAFIKKYLPETKIIAGNVAAYNGAQFLADEGADAIKVGIGQGKACSTRLQTGFTAPMLWSIRNTTPVFAKDNTISIPIIADGGVRKIADIVKAKVFGAHMVMVGSLFASCSDSAAKLDENGKKVYYGSASFDCKKHNRHIEGFTLNLESDVTVLEKMNEIEQAIQSAISYAGGTTIEDLKGIEYLCLR